MAADEIRAELKRLREENAKLKAAKPSYDWVLWVIAFFVLAAMMHGCSWPHGQHDPPLFRRHAARVLVVSECAPPCCAVDFDAGVATAFPGSCWDE